MRTARAEPHEHRRADEAFLFDAGGTVTRHPCKAG